MPCMAGGWPAAARRRTVAVCFAAFQLARASEQVCPTAGCPEDPLAGAAGRKGLQEDVRATDRESMELLQRNRRRDRHQARRAGAPALDSIQVLSSNSHLSDSKGRVRIFHGANVVYKTWPYYPPSGEFNANNSLADVDMDYLQEWGLNAVRLGVMWSGVEPEMHKTDSRYLERLVDITERLADRGVHTLLDFHQDLLSRHFCGEGVPEYYVDKLLADPESRLSKTRPFPWSSSLGSLPDLTSLNEDWTTHLPEHYALNSSGYPSMEDCNTYPFLVYYMSDRVTALFEELYTRGTELNAGVKRYWRHVAEVFAGKSQILGYELMNEPMILCNDFGRGLNCTDAQAWQSGTLGLRYMGPFYRDLSDVIRRTGAEQPILFEMPLNLPFQDKVVKNSTHMDLQMNFAYHAYCVPGDDGTSPIIDSLCSVIQTIEKSAIRMVQRNAADLQGFVTEFGAVGDTEPELDHMSNWLDFADSMFESWAYWQYKNFNDFTTQNKEEALYDEHGNLEINKLKALTRTYAQAIAGDPLRMRFDRHTNAFDLIYRTAEKPTQLGAPTEIYLNEAHHYPTGYQLDVQPAQCIWTSIKRNHVYVYVHPHGLLPRPGKAMLCQFIRVRIWPNPPAEPPELP